MPRLPFALPHQPFDRHAVIQRIAGNDPGRGIDGGACLPVTMQQSFDAAAGRQSRMFLDEATIGPAEADVAVGRPLDAEPAFVHQPVVMTAEQSEIVDRGVAAIRPVTDVMRIDETVMAATREPAAAVARLQGPAQCR